MIFMEYLEMIDYKIEKDVPVPISSSRHDKLLNMKLNDSVFFTDKKQFSSARGFLRRHFGIKTKTYVDKIIIEEEKKIHKFEARIWRIK